MKVLEWSQHYIVIFKMIKGSLPFSWWMGVAENQTHSNFYGSPCYLQMRKIHSKMKVLEWSQQISHCKTMHICYDAHGKLTPQSKVGSTLN